MAPTEGRVARPERQWGCRRGTSMATWRQTDERTDSSKVPFYLMNKLNHQNRSE